MVGNISRLTIITALYGRPDEVRRNIQSYVIAIKKVTEYPVRLFVFSEHPSMSLLNFKEILTQEMDSFTKYKIINIKPSGIYNALNIGVENADSEFIIFNHSDDCFTPNAFLHISSVDLTESDVTSFGIITSTKLIKPNISKVFPHAAIGINHAATIFRTEVHKLYFYNENLKYSADWQTIICMFENGVCFTISDLVICKFSENGASNSISRLRLCEDVRILLDSIKKNKLRSYCIQRTVREVIGHIVNSGVSNMKILFEKIYSIHTL
jgi:glycosyltransferase involved in cell wall biosynthesis